MPFSWLPRQAHPVWLIPVAIAAVGAGAWVLSSTIRRRTPAELERRRRIRLHVAGRMAEATVSQADEHTMYYSYEIAGVVYATSQDISQLGGYLPLPPHQLIGSALIKYLPANPANSILVCEHWSGLRAGAVPPRKEQRCHEETDDDIVDGVHADARNRDPLG